MLHLKSKATREVSIAGLLSSIPIIYGKGRDKSGILYRGFHEEEKEKKIEIQARGRTGTGDGY